MARDGVAGGVRPDGIVADRLSGLDGCRQSEQDRRTDGEEFYRVSSRWCARLRSLSAVF